MAQGDPLYLMEAGGTLGLVTYLGDFNAGIFRGAQPMGGLVLRRVINPYMHPAVGRLYRQDKRFVARQRHLLPCLCRIALPL